MDRNKLIEIINNPTKNNIAELIYEYCVLEHNKSIEDTNILISFAFSTGIINYLFPVALKYYKNKFNIIEIQNLLTKQTIKVY